MLNTIEKFIANLSFPQKPEGLYEPIAYSLEMGGKRIRPVLTLLAHSIYKPIDENTLLAATAVEMYHNHTLLHDDLMDGAEMRRGKLAVHKNWNANTAILSGDTMLIKAFELINNCQCTRANEARKLMIDTMIGVCEGQQYDMNFETRNNVSEAEYLEMIRLKTSILLGCAAKLGGIVADAPLADCEALYNFAERIGIAFQVQDDYLDVYGDPSVFGKKIGGDILCGKKTFLLINALELATEEQREELLALISNAVILPEEKIERVTDIYNKIDIATLTQQRITSIYEEARTYFDAIQVPIEKKQPLWDFAETLLGRKS